MHIEISSFRHEIVNKIYTYKRQRIPKGQSKKDHSDQRNWQHKTKKNNIGDTRRRKTTQGTQDKEKQHRVHKQDEEKQHRGHKMKKNNIGYTRRRKTTQGTQDEENENNNKTQCVLDITILKQQHNTICVGHHHTKTTTQHNMCWTSHTKTTTQHNMCWTSPY